MAKPRAEGTPTPEARSESQKTWPRIKDFFRFLIASLSIVLVALWYREFYNPNFMVVDNFFAGTALMARSPIVWLPALLLGASLGHAPSARALVIFDNTNNLTSANTTSTNSSSGAVRFINTTGSGTGSGNGISIPLLVTNSLYLNDASLQMLGSPSGARDIGFYLYEATPSSEIGVAPNVTQIFAPVGSALASTTLNFTPPTTGTSAYSTFNFSGTNLGSYLLSAGKTYLLMTGNITTTSSLPMAYGAATGAEIPGTTNLITWNTTGATGCLPNCKTDTLTTVNGGQSFTRQTTTSTLWKINGTQAVPTPLPLVGAGLAFGFSRRLRRRTLGQQPSA